MSCNYPLIRAETYETYINKKGEKSYKAEWLNRDEFDRFGKEYLKTRYRRITPVGCGQCTGCLLNYSRDRATQMMCEKKFGYHEIFDQHGNSLDKGHEYPDGTTWFLTVTYADEYLKTAHKVNTDTGEIFEGISLNIEDTQKFMKRLRNHYKGCKIKYVIAGEYGSKTQRPHYHYIIFGLPLDVTKFKKVGMNALNQPTWKCEELERIWGMGNIIVGRVDWRSCAYVARYTLKKAFKKDKEWYAAQGMEPEFIYWSNGIGKDYFTTQKNQIYATDSVPITTHMGGLLRTPKSYDRMLKEVDPNLYEKVKKIRESRAEQSEIAKRLQTDLTAEERRCMQEARMKQVMKDIRTEV